MSKSRLMVLGAVVAFQVVVFSAVAWATVVDTPEELIGGEAEGLYDSLFATIQSVLPYVMLLLAISIGFRWAVRFFKTR